MADSSTAASHRGEAPQDDPIRFPVEGIILLNGTMSTAHNRANRSSTDATKTQLNNPVRTTRKRVYDNEVFRSSRTGGRLSVA
jgi:hypothetical protein